MVDLVTRARTKAGMLRMGEPIAFGSDADIVDELVAEVERLNADVARGLELYDKRSRTAIERAGQSALYMERLCKLQAEINRLRPHYQSNSMLDHGRRQMLDHFESLLRGGGVGP